MQWNAAEKNIEQKTVSNDFQIKTTHSNGWSNKKRCLALRIAVHNQLTNVRVFALHLFLASSGGHHVRVWCSLHVFMQSICAQFNTINGCFRPICTVICILNGTKLMPTPLLVRKWRHENNDVNRCVFASQPMNRTPVVAYLNLSSSGRKMVSLVRFSISENNRWQIDALWSFEFCEGWHIARYFLILTTTDDEIISIDYVFHIKYDKIWIWNYVIHRSLFLSRLYRTVAPPPVLPVLPD